MILILFLTLICTTSASKCFAGVHGMGDSCERMEHFMNEAIPKGYGVYCLNPQESSLWNSIEDQALKACSALSAIDCDEVYLLALSQGGVIANYLTGTCEHGKKIKGLALLGAVNRGISSVQKPFLKFWVDSLKAVGLTPDFSYKGYLRSNDFNDFRKDSNFVTNVINESKKFNPKIKERFLELDKIIVGDYTNEDLLTPVQTAEFLWADKEGKELPFKQDRFFREDRLGILELFLKGRVERVTLNYRHATKGTNIFAYTMYKLISKTVFQPRSDKLKQAKSLEEIFEEYKKTKHDFKSNCTPDFRGEESVDKVKISKYQAGMFDFIHRKQGLFDNEGIPNKPHNNLRGDN